MSKIYDFFFKATYQNFGAEFLINTSAKVVSTEAIKAIATAATFSFSNTRRGVSTNTESLSAAELVNCGKYRLSQSYR